MLTEKIKISDYLDPLQRFGRTGRVHSVFDRSFNVMIGQQLVNINNYRNYLTGFGVFLPDALFEQVLPLIEVGNRVQVREHGLTFYSTKGTFSLSLEEKELVSLQVKELSFTSAELQLLKEILLQQKLETKIGLPEDEKTQAVFAALRQSVSDWEPIIDHLIGRGKGLTPSGDDLLVAYQAMLYALQHPEADALAQALAKPLSTTDVSLAYIQSASQGYVNSVMLQLFQDVKSKNPQVLENDVQQLMSIGHSSGKDLSFGLLLALESLSLEEKE
ncbi:DUF2877 domain-containing protein [Enterococcus casseliflavus]|uniref:DUF2877 domain-containing protein n=1 Tax=Enterococcus casseliflavus TaxID=37734 RepID=UPI001432AB51|nr:DUF2877 domain-containing protein [Enterococcus casseliflavus]NKD34242.1 DUF2877 domain-containing protein [Enterococcus casseliflavus]